MLVRKPSRRTRDLSANQGIEERLDRVNKKLDLLIAIQLVNSGMKLDDIAQTLGVNKRTIQRLLPVAKLKYAKGRKGKAALEEIQESPFPETEPHDSTSQTQV